MNSSPLGDGSATFHPFAVSLTFFGDLVFFLKCRGAAPTIQRVLKEKASVKDVIEACGVPHPEVDLILIDGTTVSFSRVLQRNSVIEVYPVNVTHTSFEGHLLQQRHITKFVADGHLGKLTRALRLLGFDVVSPYPCGRLAIA